MGDTSKYNGRFVLVSSDNFDNYMKAFGVNVALRAIGNAAKPTLEFTVNGDTWTIKATTLFKDVCHTFKLNEVLDEETMDGRKVKTTFTLDDGKLVQNQKATKEGEKDSTIIRDWISDNEMITTCLVDDIVCVRHFKRIQ